MTPSEATVSKGRCLKSNDTMLVSLPAINLSIARSPNDSLTRSFRPLGACCFLLVQARACTPLPPPPQPPVGGRGAGAAAGRSSRRPQDRTQSFLNLIGQRKRIERGVLFIQAPTHPGT